MAETIETALFIFIGIGIAIYTGYLSGSVPY